MLDQQEALWRQQPVWTHLGNLLTWKKIFNMNDYYKTKLQTMQNNENKIGK